MGWGIGVDVRKEGGQGALEVGGMGVGWAVSVFLKQNLVNIMSRTVSGFVLGGWGVRMEDEKLMR